MEGKIGKSPTLKTFYLSSIVVKYLTIRNNGYNLNRLKIHIKHNMEDYPFQSQWGGPMSPLIYATACD